VPIERLPDSTHRPVSPAPVRKNPAAARLHGSTQGLDRLLRPLPAPAGRPCRQGPACPSLAPPRAPSGSPFAGSIPRWVGAGQVGDWRGANRFQFLTGSLPVVLLAAATSPGSGLPTVVLDGGYLPGGDLPR
jgi:hypothetical protein